MRWINYQQRLRGTWCSVNLNVDQCLLRIDILQNIHISFLVASSFQCWQRIINVLLVTLQARGLSWKTHWCPPHHMKYKWADTLIGQFSSQRKICMMTPNKDMLKIERFSFLMFSNITYKNCSQHIQLCLAQINFPLFFKSWTIFWTGIFLFDTSIYSNMFIAFFSKAILVSSLLTLKRNLLSRYFHTILTILALNSPPSLSVSALPLGEQPSFSAVPSSTK